MAKTFTNRQLVGGNQIKNDYQKINLNSDELNSDLIELYNADLQESLERQSKDAEINNRITSHTTGLTEKHNAQDVNFSPTASISSIDTQNAIEEVDSRIDNIIAQSGTSDTEVVDARISSVNGSFTTLKKRLDSHESADLPHIMDVDGVNYKYGFKQESGKLQFIYEEVL